MNSKPEPKTILVVDDEEDVVIYISKLLESNGYKVISTLNSLEVCEMAESEMPSAILLDILMPNLSGYEVCKRLRQNKKTYNIPVIFITSIKGSGRVVSEALKIGGNDFVTKPFNEEKLLTRIETFIKNREDQKRELLRHKIRILLETVGATAHEINQPLTSLICNSELLLKKMDEDSPNRHYAETVNKSAKEITDIVKKLQEIKRYETKNYVQDVLILDIDRSAK